MTPEPAELGEALADAYWPDVEAAGRTVLIVPLGALEQHGPHLPLDTDTTLARHVAAEIHRLRPGSATAPAVPFGSSGEHADFPGTVSIGTDVLAAVLVELVRDATRWWRGILVVNGHGGNLDALRQARLTCDREGRHLAVAHLAVAGMDAHAGHAETSLMLRLDPARVRAGVAIAGRTEPVAELLETLRERGVRAVSASGVLGDPTRADAVHGEQLFRQLVARVLAEYDSLAARIASK